MIIDKIKRIYLSILNYNLNPKKKKILFGSLIIVIFGAVLALNMQQPLFTDDWEYSFLHRLYDCSNKGTITDERISSVSDIFKSQYEHYFTWGGRSVNHIIAQSLLFIGTPVNKVLNSLAYIALTYLIYLFSKRREEKNKLSLYLLINMLIFFFVPVLGSTILWITGSSNYLWGTTILLFFLLPYKYLFEEKDGANHSLIKASILFIGGIIAGWTNENMVAAMIFVLFIFLLYLKKTKQHIPVWFYSGYVGAITGFLFMILAPGNYVRYEIANQLKGVTETPKILILTDQFLNATSGIFFYLFGIICLYAIILIICKYNGDKNSTTFSLSLAYFSFAILATLAMSFAPVFPVRTFFGIIIFIIMAITYIYNKLDFNAGFIRELRIWAFSLACVAMAGYYMSGYKDLSKAKSIFDKREQIMTEQKKQGVMDFVFDEEITSKSRINNVYDLTNDPAYWTNCFYARYYGVNTVTVINPDYK